MFYSRSCRTLQKGGFINLVKGSDHFRDIRIISMDALSTLLTIKETQKDAFVDEQIKELLNHMNIFVWMN